MALRHRSWLAIGRCWLALHGYDLRLKTWGFNRCYGAFQAISPRPPSASPQVDMARWVHALDAASALYWKRPLCLQRSLVLAAMLRRAGVDARVVFAMRRMSRDGHAWVDVNGLILSDTNVSPDDYVIFDRA